MTADAARRVPGQPDMWAFVLFEALVFTAYFTVYVFQRAQSPDLFRASLLHARGELLADRGKADQHVRYHLGPAVGTDPRRHDPGQEFGIASDVGDEIEHLLRSVGEPPDFANAGHQAIPVFAS